MDWRENEKWCNELKVGDEVAIDTGRYGVRDYEIRKIERITPARRFSLEGRSTEFDSKGSERGNTDKWRPRMTLEPVTQKVKDHIRHKYVVARIEKASWRNFNLDKLERILAILDED